MNFIPEDYKEPVVSNYMRLQKGENVFRILSESMITGFEAWETQKKDDGTEVRRPVRTPMSKPFKITDVEDPEEIKIFWAFVVWNYADDKIQILEVTQKSVRVGMKNYIDNAKWGNPHDYDFIIIKVGEGMKTRYDVTTNPKEPIAEEILTTFSNMKVNLKALYDGADPFKSEDSEISLEEVEQIMK